MHRWIVFLHGFTAVHEVHVLFGFLCLLVRLFLALAEQLFCILLDVFLGISIVFEALDKVFWLLPVDAGQAPDVFYEFLQQLGFEGVGLVSEKRSLTEHNLLGEFGVR